MSGQMSKEHIFLLALVLAAQEVTHSLIVHIEQRNQIVKDLN